MAKVQTTIAGAVVISSVLIASSAAWATLSRGNHADASVTPARYNERGVWVGEHRYFDDASGYERAQQRHTGGAGHTK